MPFRGFKGGIHPPENKGLTRHQNFANLSVPHACYIPLQQHIGKPARPVVEVGDAVVEGQMIGAADGFISSDIHASISGKVVNILDHPTAYATRGKCIVIEAEGAFSTYGTSARRDWSATEPGDLLMMVKNAGIVGLGGAAFPTPVKLSPPEIKKIDTLIVNGAECEPYITADDMLMRTFPLQIIEGIRIALKILGISRAFIGIEKNKPEAIKALRESIKSLSIPESIEVVPLRTKYPQGAEKQLIKSIVRREVPSRGLPMDARVVVQNVSTIYAIYEAVLYGKPLFERYVTITGSSVRKPGNYKIRLGARIADIVEEIGGLAEEPAKIIMGGPMCGISLDTMEVPVIKGTNGILFLTAKEVKLEPIRPCIRCGRCVAVCPAGLIPCEMGNAVEINRFDVVQEFQPFDCIMCGSCSYVCPSKRPLSQFIRIAQQVNRGRK